MLSYIYIYIYVYICIYTLIFIVYNTYTYMYIYIYIYNRLPTLLTFRGRNFAYRLAASRNYEHHTAVQEGAKTGYGRFSYREPACLRSTLMISIC